MFKRLPILCAALLALAACSHGSDNGSAPTAPTASGTATAPAATPAPATAPAASAGTTPAPAASAAAAASPAPAPSTPPAQPFVDNGKWVEGKNYFRIEPAQPTGHLGKIEVTEAFSYGCPACNAFYPTFDQIAHSLPANAVASYLPVAFRPDENWPVYQRAFFTAQALGLVGKTHDAMFDATWKTGETATYDLATGRPKPQDAWPKIEDMAKFYAKYGADPKEFLAIANSFTVNTKMKQADEMVKAYGVDGTPTVIVDGKYRFSPTTAGGYAQSIELAQWLVSKAAAEK